MTDREKRLHRFASDMLELCSDSGGLDIEYQSVIEAAEKHGLITWQKATSANEDEWPNATCHIEEGDPFWTTSRDLAGNP